MRLNYSVLLFLSLVVESMAFECESNSDCAFLEECSTYRCKSNGLYGFLFGVLVVCVIAGIFYGLYRLNEKIQNRKTDQEREERQNYKKLEVGK